VSFNGPALFASDSWLQNQGAVLALEALKMIIPVHCPQPWSLRLSLLWHNRLLAACTHHAELLCVVLCAIDPVVGIKGDWLSLHILTTNHTKEASVVEGDSSDCQRVRRGERLVAAAAGSALRQLECLEICLTEYPAMKSEKFSSQNCSTLFTHVPNRLVVLLADGEVFVGDVARSLEFVADLTLHTPRVEVRLVHLDVVVGDLELANSALVNCFLVALCTGWFVFPGEILLAEFLFAEPTSEAGLMEEGAHGKETVVCERLLAGRAQLPRPTVTDHLRLTVAQLRQNLPAQPRRLERSRIGSRPPASTCVPTSSAAQWLLASTPAPISARHHRRLLHLKLSEAGHGACTDAFLL